MVEGRSEALWEHTSSVLWVLYSVNRNSRRGRALAPADFNPHARRRRVRPSVEQLTREILMVYEAKKAGERHGR